MRAILNRVAVLATAGLIAASAALPAAAATHHKRRAVHTAPTALEAVTPATAYPDEPAIVRNQPGACFTDEGYGRFASCDQNGF